MFGFSGSIIVDSCLETEIRRKAIADREDEYHAQRLKAVLSPVRADPFNDGMNPFIAFEAHIFLILTIIPDSPFHGLDLYFHLRSRIVLC